MLLAEDRDRALAVSVDEGEAPALRLSWRAASTVTPSAVSCSCAALAELVPAERGEEAAAAGQPRELDGGDAAAARGLRPPGSLAWTISPGAGTRSTRANSTHSTCPTTATRMRGSLTSRRRRRVSTDDGGRGRGSRPSSASTRSARTRSSATSRGCSGARPPRTRSRRRSCGRSAATRSSSTDGTCVRGSSRSRRGSRSTSGAAPARDRRAGGGGRRGRAPRLRRARASRRRAAADRAGGGRPPLRLRPLLRRHRRRARLERRGGPPGRLVRRAAPAKEGEPHDHRPRQLDRRFRAAAAAAGLLDVAYDFTDSPVGTAARRGQRARALPHLLRPRARARARGARARLRRPRPPLAGPVDEARRELDEYFEGAGASSTSRSTSPRCRTSSGRCWRARPRCPYGNLETYGGLAQRIGQPRAARAVGGALNRNPVPIVVPCHRVVGANGSLTGYGGGLERKQALLALEGALLPARRPGRSGRPCGAGAPAAAPAG